MEIINDGNINTIRRIQGLYLKTELSKFIELVKNSHEMDERIIKNAEAILIMAKRYKHKL